MPTTCGHAVRLGLALGLVAGAWVIPSASIPGVETPPQAGTFNISAEPERLVLAQADAVPVEMPVSYSSDQVGRGEERYTRECEECHGDDLKGGLNGGPPLRGLSFEQKYFDGLPASVLFGFMSSTMPPHAPGRYSPETYADLMAYVLERNGVDAGAPLPADFDALDQLIMQK